MKEERYIVLPYLPKDYTSNVLGEGANGICYLLDDETVFKKLNSTSSSIDTLRKISQIKSNHFIFPNTFVYLEDKSEESIIGYLMQYVNGFYLSNPNLNMNFLECLNNLDRIEKEMRDFAINYNLVVHDIHHENMIFKEDGSIRIIDTDLYEFDCYNEPFDVYKHNIKELSETILYMLINGISFKDERINRYYDQALFYGKCKPSYVLYEILSQIENELKEKVITLGEFTEGLKLIKK